ncbi:MAG: hypothetical protein R3Y10_05870 [Ferrimonas sp.]
MEKPSRFDWARQRNDEKDGAAKVREHWVLCRALKQLKLNGECWLQPAYLSAGIWIDYRDIDQIGHSSIVFVENLAIMAEVSQLALPVELEDPLFLYRGEAHDCNTGSAHAFFRQPHTGLKIAFNDFDPAGLQMILTSGADWALVPQPELWQALCHPDWQQLTGPERRFHAQRDILNALAQRTDTPEWMHQALKCMGQHPYTRTQEHLLVHQVPLVLLPIRPR